MKECLHLIGKKVYHAIVTESKSISAAEMSFSINSAFNLPNNITCMYVFVH